MFCCQPTGLLNLSEASLAAGDSRDLHIFVGNLVISPSMRQDSVRDILGCWIRNVLKLHRLSVNQPHGADLGVFQPESDSAGRYRERTCVVICTWPAQPLVEALSRYVENVGASQKYTKEV